MPVDTGSPLRKTRRGRPTLSEMIFMNVQIETLSRPYRRTLLIQINSPRNLSMRLTWVASSRIFPIAIEQLLRAGEIPVPKDRDQSEFSQHWQQCLDHAGAAKTSS